MITPDNLLKLLTSLGFTPSGTLYSKTIGNAQLAVDFNKKELIYPEAQGLKIHSRQTCNFASDENFVVFECVHRLLEKGYKPEHIELEPKWKLGHEAKSGRADILVRDQQNTPLLIIECKTAGREFDKAWKDTEADGAQLFSYVEQEKSTRFVCLYASEFDDKAAQLKTQQRIISVKDNQTILDDNPKALAFAKATNARERFRVWRETYQQESTETGIFEDNIQPYNIGKNKYTLRDDTKALDALDIKGAYHRFRTILRKHNVSRRENAFEVLVNLFLCKLVDELENPDDLKFYWKGIAYDNYFDLVDRLQSLYKVGMERFLNQDIVYISNTQIEAAFWPVKKRRSAVKDEIKRLFRELKFYKGLDFEFIKVFNKDYFDKNAKILLEIIQMWQGLRLTDSAQNQFLGDMFEYFLDNGIKQSEGQFFTPVPICKFIVSSLPLEQLIQSQSEPLKAIDYACGSGHFLTEYALQLPPLLKTLKQQDDPRPWHQHTYGIEKEDRLAKVAKVSAFMYGFEGIQILDADALQPHAEIREGGFNLLVANPPFAVEDFLLTLPEADRERFALLNTINDLGNKNVQCFFLERAQQLLAGGGVMGVIVPSSILSNTDTIHVTTREILLQYFDFVALTELGSNTFGKTDTNTVILFLRRKAQRPEPAEHYQNRVQDFFENWADEAQTGGGEYQDLDAVRAYCNQIACDFAHYQTLLQGAPNAELLASELFKDYRRAFDAQSESKKLRKNKKKTAAEIEAELAARFVQFCRTKEQDKLYYFLLAHHNPVPVLLIKSPADNKAQQQFLGYEWCGAKGQEGIRYFGGNSVKEIQTPLFDPADRDNANKLSALVRRHFDGLPLTIPAALQPYASQARLTDLLDFSRVEFDKAISLNAKPEAISSRWPLQSIESLLSDLDGNATKVEESQILSAGNIPVVTQGRGDLIAGYVDGVQPINDVPLVVFGDHTCTFKYVDFPFVRGADGTQLLKTDPAVILPKCFYYLLGLVSIQNSDRYERHFKYLKTEKIPLPPLNIQQQIVAECEAVDQAVAAAQEEIAASKNAIEAAVSAVSGHSLQRLADVVQMNPSKAEVKKLPDDAQISFVEMAAVSDQGFIARKVDRPLKEVRKGSYTYFAENDVIVAKITPCMENGKCALAMGLTNGVAFGSTEFHVFRVSSSLLSRFLFALLNREVVRKQAEQNFTGASGHRRVPAAFYENLQIPVLPLTEQTALVQQIEALEKNIAAAQAVIDAAPAQKQAILQRYL